MSEVKGDEVYSSKVYICPMCNHDMALVTDLTEDAQDKIMRALAENKGPDIHDEENREDLDWAILDLAICRECMVMAEADNLEDAGLYRTEYRQMLIHQDNEELVEIRRSDSPRMDDSRADWYVYDPTEGPKLTENFDGVDDAFNKIMSGIEL